MEGGLSEFIPFIRRWWNWFEWGLGMTRGPLQEIFSHHHFSLRLKVEKWGSFPSTCAFLLESISPFKQSKISIQKPCHFAIKWSVDKKNLPIQNVISLSWSTVCIDEIKDIPMGNCLISKILIFRSYFTSSILLHRSAIDGSESDRVLEYI